MGQAEFLIAALLVAVAGLGALARRLSLPYPIVLVLGGALFGFIPGMPTVNLDPNVVLVVFLPPLVYGAAFFANLGDIRANVATVTLSSVVLVIATMVAVAVTAHALIDGLPWASAFALGAIVSPTDPLAGASIMRRLGSPRVLVSAIEAEGLFNDATALVAYKIAVAAVIGGSFSLLGAGWRFLAGAAGGVAIGLAVGWIIAEIRKRTDDSQTSITISLLSGYAAFIPANALGASGVLAAVTTGLYMGIRGPRIIDARTRLQGFFVWEMLDFIINATLFVLVGLQLRTVVSQIVGRPAGELAAYAVAVSAIVIITRLVWFLTGPFLMELVDYRGSQHSPQLALRPRLVLAWSGTRGSISLAAALALPLSTDSGAPFPARDLIIFLTFAVIFATLVIQGLSLPALIRRLGVTRDSIEDAEEVRARLMATNAALAQLDDLATEDWTRPDTIDRMRRAYDYRKRRFAARAGKIQDDGYEDQSLAYQQTVQAVLAAQRETLIAMRDTGEISNETMNQLIRELDLEESRLEI
ncbi:MAG: Na+/H+ antiporter [Solirubrobacteraceae bacterium]